MLMPDVVPDNWPTNDQQPYLNLPTLDWPYFWVIEVSRDYVYLCVRRRHWWWPLRLGQVQSKAQDYVSHKGDLTQTMLDELAGKGAEMAQQVDPKKDVKRQFKGVKFNQKIRVKGY